MAQKKRSPRKSPSLILPFTKKLAIELNNHQKLKCPGSCPRGMFKLRVDRRVICIASGESKCRSIESLFCRVSELSVPSSTVSRSFTNWPSKRDSKVAF